MIISEPLDCLARHWKISPRESMVSGLAVILRFLRVFVFRLETVVFLGYGPVIPVHPVGPGPRPRVGNEWAESKKDDK